MPELSVEISIVPHMIRKPNSIIVLSFIQNNSYFKNIIIFDIARLVLFSSAYILQIADVALRIVFLLFLLCFWPLLRLVLTHETSEMLAIFVLTTKTTQPRPQVFLVNGAFTCKEAALLTSSAD